MDAREALRLAERHGVDSEVDALLVELVRAPSFHTERLESEPLVKSFAASVVAPRLEASTGVAPRVDGMGNLLWRSDEMTGDAVLANEGLLMMGYAMTFPEGSMPEPFSGKIVGGEPYGFSGPCVWGRGVSEQKGALAAMLAAAALVRRTGAKLVRPLLLAVSVAGETGRHDAARYMRGHGLEAKYGIVGLGTGNRVCLGNKGRIDVDIVVRGRSCHSSTPWEGVNAIDGARRVLDRIERTADGQAHPELGPATLVATRIDSGPAILHTIQDVCRITLDRRLLPGEDPETVLDGIRKSIGDPGPWQIDVTPGALMYPSNLSGRSELARTLAGVCESAGLDGAPCYSAAALDAGYLNHEGIETAMFGPGDLRFAHSDAEVVPLEEVRAAARVYAAAALALLA